jgi:2,3-diketo-5-methylthio-1-phosphopentane phosphatase
MAERPDTVIVVDFDGTITEKDVGDEICERFAPSTWREIDAAWDRNELSLPEAQRQMWGLVRVDRADAVAHSREVGRIRAGLDALVEAAAQHGCELWLASGGFDFYIEAILGARLGRFARAYFNRTQFTDGRIEVAFPHRELACDRCAVCKGKVCDQARARGARVIFVGDGASDRCAIGRADRLFAVRGSRLARACEERGEGYVAFERLDELLRMLGN